MNSLLKSKPKSNTKKIFFIVLCVGLSLSGVQYFFPSLVTSTALTLARPAWFVRDTFSSTTVSFFGYFQRIHSLQQENQSLQDQLYVFKVKEVEFNQMKKEYEDLKALMNTTLPSNGAGGTQVVTARVLSKPPFTPYDTFVVDGGSVDGVQMGDLVYANDALVIGRVTKVTSHTSYVTLFSSGDQTQEFVVSRTGVSVAVTGMGGGNFALYVPKDFDIQVGDVLSEPSYGLGVVAEVYAVDQTMQNSFKRVYARVPKPIFRSTFVRIGEL